MMLIADARHIQYIVVVTT